MRSQVLYRAAQILHATRLMSVTLRSNLLRQMFCLKYITRCVHIYSEGVHQACTGRWCHWLPTLRRNLWLLVRQCRSLYLDVPAWHCWWYCLFGVVIHIILGVNIY